MSSSLAIQKNILRKAMSEKLRTLNTRMRKQAGEDVCRKLGEHFIYRSAKVIMMYIALPSEVPLESLLHMAWNEGKIVALPRVEGDRLEARIVENLDQDIQKSALGVYEPRSTCRIMEPRSLDMVIVPGLAFDRLGWRLGRGKGFYDRFLITLPETVHVTGLCYAMQILDAVPNGPNDTCVKEVISV